MGKSKILIKRKENYLVLLLHNLSTKNVLNKKMDKKKSFFPSLRSSLENIFQDFVVKLQVREKILNF